MANSYPAMIDIVDVMDASCVGTTNLHGWSFSNDGGATALRFANGARFRFGADVFIDTPDGDQQAEAGLRFSPWWSPFSEGRFKLDLHTGEIVCSGGRLPYFNFTQAFNIAYLGGSLARLEITYMPNGLSAGSPATILYSCTISDVLGTHTFNSPVLAFDQGDPAQAASYGLWGCLDETVVGGYFQTGPSPGASLECIWSGLDFQSLDVVRASTSSWGRLKSLYR